MTELIEALYDTSFHDSGDGYSSSSTTTNIEAAETENNILNFALTILPLLLEHKHYNVHIPSSFFNTIKMSLVCSF